MAGDFAVTQCRDVREFAALEADWRRLHRGCRTATPFQSHPWLYSWWVSYGTAGRLRLVLVRRAGRLVAAAPLMLAFRPLPVLVHLGGGITDFCDVLLDDSCPDEAAAALVTGLAAAARTAVIDLREVRPGSAVERVLGAWPGPRRRLADSPCLELPAVPFPALLERLPASGAQRARAKLRKLDALGVEGRAVGEDKVPAAVATLLRLHRLQWQGRGVTPEHLRSRFAEHLIRSARTMVRHGEAMMTEFRLDGRVVAADLTLMSDRLAGGYLYGAHPELRARKVDVTAMLLRHCAEAAGAGGRDVLSLLRGNEPYKHHWRPDTVRNQRFLLARRGLEPLLALHAAGAAACDRVAGLADGSGQCEGSRQSRTGTQISRPSQLSIQSPRSSGPQSVG
ncbi:GNAT family N-acetyltransferase [Streptomyces sannanensis]|uniref:GNAT family N-acetyltransferase n=1 Tax=Streptomyces sannanensis TaxID=285536 RepID=A0ABP6SB56_9ACTN